MKLHVPCSLLLLVASVYIAACYKLEARMLLFCVNIIMCACVEFCFNAVYVGVHLLWFCVYVYVYNNAAMGLALFVYFV